MKGLRKDFQFRTTTNLFSRLLVIAKSGRDLDLQQAISEYEFCAINAMLMEPNGTLHTCKSKSDLMHELESLDEAHAHEMPSPLSKRYLIIDGMVVVQLLMSVKNFSTCKDLGNEFVDYIDSLLRKYHYTGGRVIFDNYDKVLPLKSDIRYQSCTAAEVEILVQDTTPITSKSAFLSSNKTKDKLTIYLADKVVRCSKHPVVAATRQAVKTNNTENPPTTPVSSQEEADTLMILHGIEVAATLGNKVDFFTQDTDVFILTLKRLPQLGNDTGIVTGTVETRRRVALLPIHKELGPERSAGLPGFHSLTGCDITGISLVLARRQHLRRLGNHRLMLYRL